jgi:cob(I)alamin adenosyltransferase
MEKELREILDQIQQDLADYQNEIGIGQMDDVQWMELFVERVTASITSYEDLELD